MVYIEPICKFQPGSFVKYILCTKGTKAYAQDVFFIEKVSTCNCQKLTDCPLTVPNHSFPVTLLM